uniref:Chromo domain-containing protein n=1 Tax=Lygus hesperus TaxID=30085 RepID=A0A0K8SL74_LYGHE
MIEQKPMIWAFLLFKNALVKQNPQKYSGGLTESSWKLYQKWCKLPENTRNAWITAGESVMKYVSMGCLKKDTSKVLPSKGSDKAAEGDDPKRPVVMKKICQRDQSGEITKIRPGGYISQKDARSSLREESEPSKAQQADDEEPQNVPPLTSMKSYKKAAETVREEEFVVERIVSRRFNPRRKQYEYLLKWEGYPPEQNTWEPAENLETCQHLLKAFEESLNKQALKMKNVQGRKSDYNMPGSSGSSMSNFGRPVRSSKQKALSQVKQWCGSIKPDEAEIETLMKRKLSPTDSDDDEDGFVGKRMRLGSDSEESIGGRGSMKGIGGIMKKNTNAPTSGRGPGRPRKYPLANGMNNSQVVESSDEGEGKSTLEILSQANVTKTLNLSPANQQVLVANAKGVVKVDPSQVPNLSSGVYIMSNKSGIIKLDSVSPSKALSMKQGIVKDISPSLKGSGAGTPQLQPSKSVVMLNKSQTPVHHEIPQKSGIVRKTQMSTTHVTQRVVPTTPTVFPGARTPIRQPRTTGSIKINSPNPNTRFLHSGASRQNVSITPSNKPKTVIRTTEPQKRIIGFESRTASSQNRIERGGILSGSMRGGRGATVRSGITRASPNITIPNRDNVGINDKAKSAGVKGTNHLPSSDSESGLPDDFPADLPPIAPASPPRPLSLCPETGKVLLKAEGEKTPEPLPSPTIISMSTAQPTATDIQSTPIIIKEEYIEKSSPGISDTVESEQILSHPSQQVHQQNLLKPIRPKKEPDTSPPKAKKSLVKRTLGKPGSIGSMTVSPKKILPEIEDPDSDVVTISGEDGMIYKVSKSELNNSLLMAGEDGQQCVYLTTGENGDENATVITLDPSSYTEQVNQLGQVNVLNEVGEEGQQFYVKEGEEGELMDIQVQEGAEDGQSQLVAQLVEAGEPAPGGGPRRVVLLLPDGNLMMTEVDEEQYAALELDKFQGQTAEIE